MSRTAGARCRVRRFRRASLSSASAIRPALASGPCRADPAMAPVVIVGAGLTGLTTAYELRKAGIEVVLLEANPRAGGRIQTVSFADGTHVEAHMEEYWERSPAYRIAAAS